MFLPPLAVFRFELPCCRRALFTRAKISVVLPAPFAIYVAARRFLSSGHRIDCVASFAATFATSRATKKVVCLSFFCVASFHETLRAPFLLASGRSIHDLLPIFRFWSTVVYLESQHEVKKIAVKTMRRQRDCHLISRLLEIIFVFKKTNKLLGHTKKDGAPFPAYARNKNINIVLKT